jgi:hypothetical protein
MRDLGLMGESAFTTWCAAAGLVPNPSIVDKTGWDFIVEFPFTSGLSPLELHHSAVTCMVQVKSTDKTDRKLSIALSNLRRLVTAQMPTFFVFIEFDGEPQAKRVFVVHVDERIIRRTLQRIHEIEQSDGKKDLNKRTLSIPYGNDELLDDVNGECLKQKIIKCIGSSHSDYIVKKNSLLSSSGFEDGACKMTFTTTGEDSVRNLINISIGLKGEVPINSVTSTFTRFGVPCKTPFIDRESGLLSMPDIKPSAEVTLRFKKKKLTSGWSFGAKLYISPFHYMTEESLRKSRIETKCFDILFNTHTGKSSFNFTINGDDRVEAKEYLHALKVFEVLSIDGNQLFCDLIMDTGKKFPFMVTGKENKSDAYMIDVLECALALSRYFEVEGSVNITPNEIFEYGDDIIRMHEIINSKPASIRFEFRSDSEGDVITPEKDFACIILTSTNIGSHSIGCYIVAIGTANVDEEGKIYMVANRIVIEDKVCIYETEVVDKELLAEVLGELTATYLQKYHVVQVGEKKIIW